MTATRAAPRGSRPDCHWFSWDDENDLMWITVKRVVRFYRRHRRSWGWLSVGGFEGSSVAKDTADLHSEHLQGKAPEQWCVFLWAIELSVISHCDSRAGHMDNSISKDRVPVRQQVWKQWFTRWDMFCLKGSVPSQSQRSVLCLCINALMSLCSVNVLWKWFSMFQPSLLSWFCGWVGLTDGLAAALRPDWPRRADPAEPPPLLTTVI